MTLEEIKWSWGTAFQEREKRACGETEEEEECGLCQGPGGGKSGRAGPIPP